MIPGRHANRVVLVTGAGSGIGAAIAKQYAREGATLALVDVNADNLAAQAGEIIDAGGSAYWAIADVADYSQCQQALQVLQQKVGDIDTLINNAGISPKHQGKPAKIWEMDPAEWATVIGVNLNGAFNWSRLLTPGMVERRFGSIVNMSSVAAKTYVGFTASHYGTTKAAIIGFTRELAGELGQFGINVNAIAPGRINTPLIKTAPDATNRRVIEDTAMRRLGEPSEVAEMSCFLTGPESAFVTGQVVDVAGGWVMT